MSDDDKTGSGSGTLTDWSYASIVEAQGLAVYGVTHDGLTFAERAGLIKSYAALKSTAGEAFVPFDLGTEGMTVGDPPVVSTTGKRTPDYYYEMSHSLDARFSIQNFAGSDQRLSGRQYFAFTESSDTPRHETANVASAGRFYPSLDFRVNGQDDADLEAIETLRFDFWLEPDVGPGGRRESSGFIPLELTFDSLMEGLFGEDLSKRVPQQAGLFRDRDHGVIMRLWESGGLGKPGEQVFDSAEKPLLWEVAANGIIDGGKSGWDNIHVWGFHPDGIVSTPGMPYGMHLHWRWAAALTDKTSMILGGWMPDRFRAPELAGRDLSGGIIAGGPMIDPRNPLTDLRIAVVTKATAEAYAQKTAAAHDDFVDMFRDIRNPPAKIEDGDELVVIISIVVHRQDRRQRWEGTVFPHGLFFPHVYDIGYLGENALTQAGAYEPQYLRTKPLTPRWMRDPR
jgi:hypothetical protein